MTTPVRVLPYGPAAWLVEPAGDPAAWARGLHHLGHPGVREVVPAETTVLVVCDRAQWTAVGAVLPGVRPRPGTATDEPPVVIDVVYDGDDLDATAEAVGVSADEVVRRHATGTYQVAFCGFSPGFAYLRGLDPALHLPRRNSPRSRVPAGAVAIAAGYSAVYPTSSPGGWHLLGHTTQLLWDPGADEPAVLRPGRAVRFRKVDT